MSQTHLWASGIFKNRTRQIALLITMKTVNTQTLKFCGVWRGLFVKANTPELQPVNLINEQYWGFYSVRILGTPEARKVHRPSWRRPSPSDPGSLRAPRPRAAPSPEPSPSPPPPPFAGGQVRAPLPGTALPLGAPTPGREERSRWAAGRGTRPGPQSRAGRGGGAAAGGRTGRAPPQRDRAAGEARAAARAAYSPRGPRGLGASALGRPGGAQPSAAPAASLGSAARRAGGVAATAAVTEL